ncbi:matrix-binding protein EbhB [Streptococcus suis]|nr:matrix-binding protein EbhB [Streptococcus suis]NQP12784.1 matrix-binding protein EbhB [Streptococcus suis]HEM5467666.1 matrix-binding protein EbhB [Streptococcus suis]
MLYLLDKDARTVKWNGIPLHEASSAIVKEEVNGDFVLTVRYPITDSGIYQLIKEDMLIKAPVPVLGAQLFRIKKPIENDDSLDITAYHITDDIMQRSITPVSVVGQGCAMALSQMVQNAKTDLGTFSFTSDIMDSRTFNTTETGTLYSVLLDGKHSIVGTWEGELVRDNFALTIKRSRGADRGVVITTHKNLKSYQRTKNSQSVVTRIHAKSTFKAEGAEEETTINVTVDSPLIGNYPYINEKDYENNNAKTVDELRKWAEAKFKNEGIDKVSDAIEIEAYELDGQVIHLGDTVNIKSRKHNVDIHKKAIAYEYNALTEEYISITFDDKPGVGGSGVSSGLSNAADVILGVNANTQEVAIERAVRNANQAFDAEFEKRVEEINDGIEQSKAEAERYADAIKQEIDTEIAQVNTSMQAQSEEHDRQVADILSKTQSVESLANQAKTDAASAIARANQAKTEAIADARAQVATVSQVLNTAKTELQTAIASADQKARDSQASATTLRNDLNLQASKILEQARAQTALTSRVTTIETLADGTRSTVAELSKTVSKATGDIASVSSRTKTVEDNLSQTRTQYEALTQAVNGHTGQIDSINRKTADLQSGIDGVTERFENLRVGGENLLTGTTDFSGSWLNSYSWTREAEKYRGLTVMSRSGEWLGISQAYASEINETYTFSCYIKSSVETDTVNCYFTHPTTGNPAVVSINSRSISVSNVWKRISVTFSVTRAGNIFPRIERFDRNARVYIAGLKLERGTVATDWSPSEEDLRSEIATYKRTAEESSAELSRQIQLADGKAVEAKTYAQQTAEGFKTRLESLETYKDGESTRANQYLSASRTETAKQITAERTAIANNYVAKSIYDENVRGTTLKLNEIKTTADTAKQNLATYQNTVDGKLEELTSSTQSLDGRINTASAKITQNAQEINKRLTSTQVESAITGKGYQTKSDVDSNITGRGYITSSALQPYALSTNVQNLVQETADSFSRTISETKALIPTSVSHRNLIAGTSDRWGAYQTINANSNWVASLGRVQFGDSSGIYAGSKVHLYVHISADEITFDPAVTTRTIKIQGPILHSQNVWVWANSHLYHPFYNKWSSNLTTGNNYRLIKLTSTITQEMYQQSKGFELQVRIDGVKTGKFHVRALMVSTGDIFPDYWTPSLEDLATVTALHNVTDTVSSHTRTISALDSSVSQAIQTATGILSRVGTLESNVADKSSVSAVQNQVSQLAGSWAVQNLTSSGQILNQFNLLANGANRIDGRLTHITGQTLIDNGVINNAMIGNLDAGKITTGTLDAARIKADSIDGSKMVFDQAFVNKMTANEALFKQLFAQSAFITSVQAVTMSAGQIVGGVLKATNGAAEFDLNNAKLAFNSSATIEFNSSGNALIRKVGDVTGFLHFNNATAGGTYVGLGVTSHNEGVKSQNTGRFAGIRIFRSNDTTDQTEIYGDKIYLGHGFNGNGITITATKLSTSYELVDVINSIRALWRCWLHWNGTGWNPDDMAMRRSVINEYNTYNIG